MATHHSSPPPSSSNPLPAPSSESTLAQRIDAFAVYEEAVQSPTIECSNLSSLYYNAQPIGSPRPNARILREDFSSTAAVACHWLTLQPGNTSQAVDLDLDALEVARRRVVGKQGRYRTPMGEKWRVRLMQHAELNGEKTGTRWLEDEEQQNGQAQSEVAASQGQSTWDEGATTDRFERRFQAKQAKLRQKHRQDKEKEKTRGKAKAKGKDRNRNARDRSGSLTNGHENDERQPQHSESEEDGPIPNLDTDDEDDPESPHLLLLHSSVLSLPVPPPPPSIGTRHSKAAPPDIVASLNYALSYFHKRKDLVAYLTSVRKSLRRGTGVLICDQFAGPLGEAARKGYGQGRELSSEEEIAEQEELWCRFSLESGFLRRGESSRLPEKLKNIAGVQLWRPPPPPTSSSEQYEQVHTQDGANPAVWPRGRLSLVRKGVVSHGGRDVAFEYWREDAPLDLLTNRFRMSLSFRFVEDGSWIRDLFSYDFRYWTLAEVKEAMDEAGFADVAVEVLDRGAGDRPSESDSDAGEDEETAEGATQPNGQQKDPESHESKNSEGDEESSSTFDFFQRMEIQEAKPQAQVRYRTVEEGEMVFARRSFGTYIVARAPP